MNYYYVEFEVFSESNWELKKHKISSNSKEQLECSIKEKLADTPIEINQQELFNEIASKIEIRSYQF